MFLMWKKVTGDSDVQATKVEGTTQVTIKTRTLSLDERQELEDTLAENCDVDASTITSPEYQFYHQW